MSRVVALPRVVLEQVKAELRTAAWFAALGEPLTDGDRADADSYAKALGLGTLVLGQARDWPEAERVLKAPDWSPTWWDREEVRRRWLVAEAGERYPERALWAALTELTTEAGDVVHGRAGVAAARMGNAAKASIHVAAGGLSTGAGATGQGRRLALRKQVSAVRRGTLAAGRRGLYAGPVLRGPLSP